ncbi:MAG: hypothetical protein ACRD8Z_03825, partial [Nitrososphaeraceae archaeon]
LYYNMSSPLSVEQILSQSHVSQNPSRNRYGENEDERLLLDDAEQAYNSMMDVIVNRCINEVPNDTTSLSPVLPLPIIQADPSPVAGNDVILDSGELSHINFVYNNITFQVYPEPKEKSDGSGIWPIDE